MGKKIVFGADGSVKEEKQTTNTLPTPAPQNTERKKENKPRSFAPKTAIPEVEDFVRGKRERSPEGEVAPHQKKNDDILFGKVDTKGKKKQKNATGKTSEKGGKSTEGKGRGKMSVLVPTVAKTEYARMSFKQVHVGGALLAAIRSINEIGLTVNLPAGLVGYVPLREVSDIMGQLVDEYLEKETSEGEEGQDGLPSLSDMFSIGQIISVIVTKVETNKDHKRIDLSMRPSLLNANVSAERLVSGAMVMGSVKSVEEKGYVIDFGTQHTTGFLNFSKVPVEVLNGNERLSVGLPLRLVVLNRVGRVANVTADPKQVIGAVTKQTEEMSLVEMQAGMLVKARVGKALNDGFVAHFPGWTATVDLFSLSDQPAQKWKESYEKTDGMGRILYVNYEDKRIGLSMKPHIVSLSGWEVPSVFSEGQVINDAVVQRIDPKQGVILQATTTSSSSSSSSSSAEEEEKGEETSGSIYLFAAKTKAKEKKKFHDSQAEEEDQLTKKYRIGSKVQCRVLQFNYLEGTGVVTLDQKLIDQTILYHSDVKPGMVLKAQVLKAESFGVLFKLGQHVVGLCPSVHLSDGATEASVSIKGHAEQVASKFLPGKTVTVRVLKVDPEKKRSVLTAKPSLVKLKDPILNYEEIPANAILQGFVSAVKPYGLVVEFFNGVHGWLSDRILRQNNELTETQKLHEAFFKGQLVSVRAIKVDAPNSKLLLTTSSDTTSGAGSRPGGGKGKEPYGYPAGLEPGAAVRVKITAVEPGSDATQARLKVQIQEATHINAYVAQRHLSDHNENCEKLLAAYTQLLAHAPKTPQFLDCVVLHTDGTRALHLTAKSAIVAALKASKSGSTISVPASLDEVAPDMLLQGFVRAINQHGVFVEFLNRFAGLAAKTQLSDRNIPHAIEQFVIGQTVRARVLAVDKEKERFSVTLKPSLTTVAVATEGLFAISFFEELQKIEEASKYDVSSSSESGGKKPAPSKVDWSRYVVGGSATASVNYEKDFGVVVALSHDDDKSTGPLGLAVRPHHTDEDNGSRKKFAAGTQLPCRILDVNKKKGVCDITFRPELVKAHTKAGGNKKKSIKKGGGAVENFTIGQSVDVTVQIVRDEYVVVSAPHPSGEAPSIGFICTHSYNTRFSPHSVFRAGTVCAAKVLKLADTPADRLILALDHKTPHVPQTKYYDDSIKSSAHIVVGKVIRVRVDKIFKEQGFVRVSFGSWSQLQGRIHFYELVDTLSKVEDHLASLEVGSFVYAKVLQVIPLKVTKANRIKKLAWLSTKTSEVSEVDTVVPRSIHHSAHGSQVTGFIRVVKPGSIVVDISNGVSGTPLAMARSIDVTQDLDVAHNLTAHFKPFQAVVGRVMKKSTHHHEGDHHTSSSSSEEQIHIQLIPFFPVSDPSSSSQSSESSTFETDSRVLGLVAHVTPIQLTVRLPGGRFGTVHVTQALPASEWTDAPFASYNVGDCVLCRVISDTNSSSRAKLSLREEEEEEEKEEEEEDAAAEEGGEKKTVKVYEIKDLSDLKVGKPVKGYVKLTTTKGCFVYLNSQIEARVLVKQLSRKFVSDPVGEFPPAKFVTGVITGVDTTTADGVPRVELSLKRSTTRGGSSGVTSQATFDDSIQFEQLKVGEEVTGKVSRIEKYGVFINIDNSRLSGLCHISQVADKYVKGLAEYYKPGDLVRCRVVALDASQRRISLGMKASLFEDTSAELAAIRKEKEEEKRAKKEEKDAKKKQTHLKMDSDDDLDNVDEEEKEEKEDEDDDDDVEMENKENNNISTPTPPTTTSSASKLGKIAIKKQNQKSADDHDEDNDDGQEEEEEEKGEEEKVKEVEEKKEIEKSKNAWKLLRAEVGDDDDNNNSKMIDNSKALKVDVRPAKTTLSLPPGFAQGSDSDEEDDSSSSRKKKREEGDGADEGDDDEEEEEDEEEGGGEKNKKRRKKAKDHKEQERRVAVREQELAEGGHAPTSPADFERLLVASPNNSFIWISYIDYHLNLSEVDHARAIAQRALNTIDIRESKEKLNVWIAQLNLEHLHGTPTTFNQVLEKALQYNDKKAIYLRTATLLQATNKLPECTALYEVAVKKLATDMEVWIQYAWYLYKTKQFDAGRALLQRATERLSKINYVDVVAKFAQMEFKFGTAERGRTLFEGVLTNYPKRVDIWSQYLDMEIKAGSDKKRDASVIGNNQAVIRRLFERVVHMNHSTKKMKFLLKRYLTYETAHGEASTVQHVKKLAMEYVQSKVGSA